MSIEDRNTVVVGARLVARFKQTDYVCTVEAGEDGKLSFALEDGKRYTSPSAAGSAVMGGTACNGWRFWSVEGAAPATSAGTATAATRLATQANSATRTAKATRKPRGRNSKLKVIRVYEHQEDVPEGQVRYWCGACLDAFLGFEGQVPEQCPNGHRADDPELTAAVPAEVLADAAE